MPLTDESSAMFFSRSARAPRSTPSAESSEIPILGPTPETLVRR